MTPFIITGTDTDVGKTLVSAMLVRALKGVYWKPIQCGAEPQKDIEIVEKLTGMLDSQRIPTVYDFKNPLSPHRAAELEATEIEPEKILAAYKSHVSPLASRFFIEGAGGLMVPITRELLQIDLFQQIGAPLILVARTGLGTINHTLLSVEAIRARNLLLHGIIFTGPDNADNMQTIAQFSGARILGHLPQLAAITPQILERTFADNFNRADFV